MTQEVVLKVAMACEVSSAVITSFHQLSPIIWPPRASSVPCSLSYPLDHPDHLQGCSGAVKRVLDRMEGVQSVDIDLPSQKVVVRGNLDPQKVKETVAKTGKATEFWS